MGAVLSRVVQSHRAASPMAEKFANMPSIDFFIRPADGMFPLKTGDELFIDGPDAEPNDKLQFRFEVAFGEQGIVFGAPILETLSSMIKLVEGIPPKFEPHLQ